MIADHDDAIPVLDDWQPPFLRPHAERGVDVVAGKRHRDPLDAVVCSERRRAGAEEKEAVEKLQVLGDAGVTQFNVYLMNGDEREQLERIGREIIPKVRELGIGSAS